MHKHRSTVAVTEAPDPREWPSRPASDNRRGREAPAAAGLPIVGILVGVRDSGATPLVTYPGVEGGGAIACRALLDVHPRDVGRQALLVFEHGDPRLPIIVGYLRDGTQARTGPARAEIEADQERMTVVASQQIVLRCGKASITLTKAGKVIVRGEYISQRSSGVLRIKGGCVEIN